MEIIPDVYEQYKNTGVDISKEPMEIYPSMHHMMGGIKINEWGETIVLGLYAVGEVAGEFMALIDWEEIQLLKVKFLGEGLELRRQNFLIK